MRGCGYEKSFIEFFVRVGKIENNVIILFVYAVKLKLNLILSYMHAR